MKRHCKRATLSGVVVSLVLLFLGAAEGLGGQETASLSGTVTSGDTGAPVEGAGVSLPELDLGVFTGEDGRYVIRNLPAGTYEVRVQRLGYQPTTRTVTLAAGQLTEVDFVLAIGGIALEEIIVTGTGGAVRRRAIGNVVETIDTLALRDAPGNTISDVLAARVPGMTAMVGGGETGSETSFRLRGAASISRTNEPLIYIDGIRINNKPDSIGSQPFTLTQLDLLDPNDIERVEVLKGASATTLYGTEASNGVIQVFTKSGRQGPPQVRLRVRQGLTSLPKDRIPVNVSFVNGELLRSDARDAVTRTGYHHDYTLSATGRTEGVGYYTSLGYMNETGAVIENALQQFTGRLNLTTTLGDLFNANLSLGYSDRELDLPGSRKIPNGPFPNAILAFPQGISQDRPYGEIFVPIENGAQIERKLSVQNFLGSGVISFSPNESWSADLTVGVQAFEEEFDYLEPFGVDIEGSTDGAKRLDHDTELHLTVDVKNNWRVELTERLGSRLTVGGQLFYDKKETDFVSGDAFPGPGLETIGAASVITGFGESQIEVVSGGFFLQEELALNDRLFLTGAIRIDGNSAFGEEFSLQPYPKASVSWVVSEEPFWNVRLVNSLKLRASYGTAGLAPGPFDAQRTFAANIYGDQPALLPGNVGDPNLKPEESREIEAGFEAALLEGRLNLQFTYFDQKTTDALVPKSFPPSEGFLNPQLINAGEISNRGLEVAVDALILDLTDVTGSVQASLSTLDSEVDLAGAGPIRPGYFRYRNYLITGFQPGAFFGTALDREDPFDIIVDGVSDPDDLSGFNSLDQVAVRVLQNAAGSDSLAFLGNAQPDVYGSFSADVELWGSLRIRSLFNWEIGSHAYNVTGFLRTQLGIEENSALLAQELANSATPDARKREIAEEFAHLSARAEGNWVEENDYLRWRELSINYELPTAVAEQFLGAERIALFVSGQNLALWTGYSGSDPVSNEAGATNFVRNTDFLQAPVARRFLLGVDVAF